MAKIKTIAVCGIGGSALPGHALTTWSLVEKVPLQVVVWNSYDLPRWIDKSTPVFCISYSGNTEETLSCFIEAKKRGCKTFAITSGGKLEALAKKSRTPTIIIPTGILPRLAIAPMTIALLKGLEQFKITHSSSVAERAFKSFRPRESLQETKSLARKFFTIKKSDKNLQIRIPLIYTPHEWYAVGHIWKIILNETAKIPAFSYTLPEANHNEMEGVAEFPVPANREFHALFLSFKNSHPRTQKRIALSQKIWQKAGITATNIVLSRDEFWTTFVTALQRGYALSHEIAKMRQINPDTTTVIEKFKREIKKQ